MYKKIFLFQNFIRMKTDRITLSSEGLKNIVKNSSANDREFSFIFSKQEIKMNNINAEFISPAVSKLHCSDPTVDFINFDNLFNKLDPTVFEKLLTKDIITHFVNLSNGDSIDISKNQVFSMQLLSILIENEELFSKLEQINPLINENNLSKYISNLKFLYFFNKSSRYFNFSKIIDFVSRSFYCIDLNELLKLPKNILYMIVRNPSLRLRNEDSLLDFINKIFSNKQSKNKVKGATILDFYETIEFNALSENKFKEFIEKFEPSEISNTLWYKLTDCFYCNSYSRSKKNTYRYSKSPISDDYFLSKKINTSEKKNFQFFEFDGDNSHSFQGIIYHLTQIAGGNVHENGIVEVSAISSCRGHEPKCAVDLDSMNYFACDGGPNQWLRYDFKELKVHPTHYSIRSRNSGSKGFYHLKSWAIEGSNSDDDDNWVILDQRNNVTCLDNKNSIYTFKIDQSLSREDYYRYIRLRQTDVNTGGNDSLRFSSLEFFGAVKS